MPKHFSLLLLLVSATVLKAQDDPTRNRTGRTADKPVFAMHLDFGFQTPLSDLKVRFGNFNSIAAGAWYKFTSQWTIGGTLRPFFGGQVKEPNLLGDMVGPSGSPIDQNGMLHLVRSYMRGSHWQLQLGRVVPFTSNPHSGLHFQLGMGFIQHKIKFSYDERSLPQLNPPYQAGYDRLSNGLALSQSVILQHVDQKTGLSVFAGIEAVQGFAESRRDYTFPLRTKETGIRADNYLSFKGGLLIPVFRKKRDDEAFFN